MAIGTISEELKAYPDYLFNEEALVSTDTVEGVGVQIGGTQAELEVVAIAATDIVTPADNTTVITLTGDSAIGGAYATTVATLASLTAGTVTAGTELGRYVWKPSDPMFGRCEAAASAASTGKVTCYLRRIAR